MEERTVLDEAERRGFFPRRGLRPGEEKNGYEGRTSLAGQKRRTGAWFDLMPWGDLLIAKRSNTKRRKGELF